MSLLKKSWLPQRLEKVLSVLELFLITGPTLIGWLLGILKYPRGDIRFRLGFQGGLIFLIYIFFIVLNFLIAYMGIFLIYKSISNYIHSCLVFIYFVINLYVMGASLVGHPPLLSLVNSYIDRFLR